MAPLFQMALANKNVSVLLGAQWGDEGKGKIIDYLIENHKVCRKITFRTMQALVD